MAKIPAYITIAFDLTGVLTIQQIQYREVLDADGVLTEVKQYPPDLIKAPQENDQLTALLKDAVGAIAAGHLETLKAAFPRWFTAPARPGPSATGTGGVAIDVQVDADRRIAATAMKADKGESGRDVANALCASGTIPRASEISFSGP